MNQEFYRIKRLPPYIFSEINNLKADLRKKNVDIIDFGMGNPDIPTPKHIVDKLVETSQDTKMHRYSASRGITGLRKANAKYYERRFNVKLDYDKEIIATIGSKEGLANMAQVLASPGDTILVPNPAYPIHAFGFIINDANLIHYNINSEVYIPDRLKDGYGPNIFAFDQFIEKGIDTVITVDCGSASIKPLEYANKNNIKVIIIDHHKVDNILPECFAHINPTRKDDNSKGDQDQLDKMMFEKATSKGGSKKDDASSATKSRTLSKKNNQMNIVESNGFIIDIVRPSVSVASVSPEQPQSVMLPLSIDFTLSEVAQSANINFGSARGDLANIEPKYSLDSTKLNVSFTPPFTSGDQITLDINVVDLAGNESETISYTYIIGFLGDYDFDDKIGINDLNVFVNGWRLYDDITKELGPVTGTAPYFRPQPDGVFDLRDGMAFVRMWRWYQSNSSGKILAKQLPSIGKQVAIETAPDHFTIVPPRGTKAVEVVVSYPVKDIDLSMASIEAVTDEAITLTWVDTASGSILLHSAQLKGNSTPIRIDVGHLQKELDVPIDISYQFIGKDSQMIGSGNTVHEIMPVPTEFALHNNYPNPFNPTTTINYDLPQDGSVRLIIYDVMGREVTRLVNGFTPAGYHSVRWDARNKMGENVSAGVYFYHLQSGNFVKTQKMVLLK